MSKGGPLSTLTFVVDFGFRLPIAKQTQIKKTIIDNGGQLSFAVVKGKTSYLITTPEQLERKSLRVSSALRCEVPIITLEEFDNLLSTLLSNEASIPPSSSKTISSTSENTNSSLTNVLEHPTTVLSRSSTNNTGDAKPTVKLATSVGVKDADDTFGSLFQEEEDSYSRSSTSYSQTSKTAPSTSTLRPPVGVNDDNDTFGSLFQLEDEVPSSRYSTDYSKASKTAPTTSAPRASFEVDDADDTLGSLFHLGDDDPYSHYSTDYSEPASTTLTPLAHVPVTAATSINIPPVAEQKNKLNTQTAWMPLPHLKWNSLDDEPEWASQDSTPTTPTSSHDGPSQPATPSEPDTSGNDQKPEGPKIYWDKKRGVGWRKKEPPPKPAPPPPNKKPPRPKEDFERDKNGLVRVYQSISYAQVAALDAAIYAKKIPPSYAGQKIFISNILFDDLDAKALPPETQLKRFKEKIKRARNKKEKLEKAKKTGFTVWTKSQIDAAKAERIELIKKMFESFGPIIEWQEHWNEKYAFATYENKRDAETAVKSLQPHEARKAAVRSVRASLRESGKDPILAPRINFYVRWPKYYTKLLAKRKKEKQEGKKEALKEAQEKAAKKSKKKKKKKEEEQSN